MRIPPLALRAAMVLAILFCAGCAGPTNRQYILDELDPNPMTPRAWDRAVGVYSGPIRSTTMRNGYEGLSTRDVRIDLSGSADDPQVWFKEVNDFSGAWTTFAEHKSTYTNIPARRYGSQGWLIASTHAPNQLLIRFRRSGLAVSAWRMILTFNENGSADVEFIGHSGWRGSGELWRSTLPASR